MFASWIGQLLNMLVYFFMSLERLLEYKAIPQEAARETDGDGALPVGWPLQGEIEFAGAALRYRPELPLAIKSLDLTIPGGSHVGVVGRTGAGKSSMMSLLFRLVEASAGTIRIDGCDIATLGLRKLRSAINIIPQDPILLEGTVRSNLDPFQQYEAGAIDAAIAKVMEGYGVVDSAPAVEGDSEEQHHRRAISADMNVAKDGGNFSAGERQLLALARAMLYRRKITIMDEPTSSVDMATDARLQPLIREVFADMTLLTIAHRLNTVISMDKILVLSDGAVLEYGQPGALLEDAGGALSAMVDAMGAATVRRNVHSRSSWRILLTVLCAGGRPARAGSSSEGCGGGSGWRAGGADRAAGGGQRAETLGARAR